MNSLRQTETCTSTNVRIEVRVERMEWGTGGKAKEGSALGGSEQKVQGEGKWGGKHCASQWGLCAAWRGLGCVHVCGYADREAWKLTDLLWEIRVLAEAKGWRKRPSKFSLDCVCMLEQRFSKVGRHPKVGYVSCFDWLVRSFFFSVKNKDCDLIQVI